MRNFMKRIYIVGVKILRMIWRVNWFSTVRLNFACLPFCQAIKLPILLYEPKIRNLCGKIHISKKVTFGMIRLGCWYAAFCPSKPGITLNIEKGGVVIFDSYCMIGSSSVIEVGNHGHLHIGKNVSISGSCRIGCRKKIVIGENFSCSWNTGIYDTDFHLTCSPRENVEKLNSETEPQNVVIGKDCWLCQDSIILKGSSLPDRTIVGAKSLVKGNYLVYGNNILIAGIPAKLLKRDITRVEFVKFELYPLDSIVKHCGL